MPLADLGVVQAAISPAVRQWMVPDGMTSEVHFTYLLADAEGGTEVVGLHEDLPPGVSPDDNELGWRMSMDKLAHLVEERDERKGHHPGQAEASLAACSRRAR